MAFADKPATDVLNPRCPQLADLAVAICFNEGSGTALDNVGDRGAAWDGVAQGGGTSWSADEGGALVVPASSYVDIGVSDDTAYPTGTMVIRFKPDEDMSTANIWSSGSAVSVAKALNVVASLSSGTLEVKTRHKIGLDGTATNLIHEVSHSVGDVHTVIVRWGLSSYELFVNGVASDDNITSGAWNPNDNDVVLHAATAPYLGYDNDMTFYAFHWWDDVLTNSERAEIEDDPYLPHRPGFATDFAMTSRTGESVVSVSVTTDGSDPNTFKFRPKHKRAGIGFYTTGDASAESAGSSTERLVVALTGMATTGQYDMQIEYQLNGAGDWIRLGENRSTGDAGVITGAFWTGGEDQKIAVFADSHIKSDVSDSATEKAQMYLRVLGLIADGDYCACIDVGDEQHVPHTSWPVDDLATAYSWYEAFRNLARPLLDKVPYFLALGNHEGEGGDFQGDPALDSVQSVETQARKLFLLNPEDGEAEPEPTEPVAGPYTSNVDWIPDDGANGLTMFNANIYTDSLAVDHTAKLGQNTSPLGNYYTMTLGDIQFWILDPFRYTTPAGSRSSNADWTLGTEQTAWLTTSLGTSTATWKVVVCHHLVGGYSDVGYKGRGGAGLVLTVGTEMYGTDGTDGLHGLINDAGVNLFLFGHQHLFHHGRVGNVHYVQCGTPSAFIGDVDWDTYGYNGYGHVSKAYGFVELEATPSALNVRFIKTMEDDGTTPAYDVFYGFVEGRSEYRLPTDSGKVEFLDSLETLEI